MKEIQLTQNQVALVDDDMYEELNQFKWYVQKDKNTFYALRSVPKIKGKQKKVWMQHAIIGKPPKGLEVDHRNGQGVDNQRDNLRFVTHRQNSQNRKNQKKTSNYPGVCWANYRNKWQANILINEHRKHLGHFTDEKEAFQAYQKAVNDLNEEIIEGGTIL